MMELIFQVVAQVEVVEAFYQADVLVAFEFGMISSTGTQFSSVTPG